MRVVAFHDGFSGCAVELANDSDVVCHNRTRAGACVMRIHFDDYPKPSTLQPGCEVRTARQGNCDPVHNLRSKKMIAWSLW